MRTQICFLTDSFLQQHKNDDQILRKSRRPYLIFDRDSETYWAVPFRSNLSRSKYCFDFSVSDPNAHPGGLDFEKMLIVRKENVNFASHPAVDPVSLKLVHRYKGAILRKAQNYISVYSKTVLRFIDKFDKPKILRESSLRYFHYDLNLPDRQSITNEQSSKFDKLKSLAKKGSSKIYHQFAKGFMSKINALDVQAVFGDVETAIRHTMRDLLAAGFSEKQIVSTVMEYSPTLPSRHKVYKAIKAVEETMRKNRRHRISSMAQASRI